MERIKQVEKGILTTETKSSATWRSALKDSTLHGFAIPQNSQQKSSENVQNPLGTESNSSHDKKEIEHSKNNQETARSIETFEQQQRRQFELEKLNQQTNKEFDMSCLTLQTVKVGFKNANCNGSNSRCKGRSSVEELESQVRFRTQPFVCEVAVGIQRSFAKSNWSLGLVLASSEASLDAQFEFGGTLKISSHPLSVSGYRMLNDGDGVQLPFATHTNAMLEIDKYSILADQVQRLSYNCVFAPYTQWDILVNGRRHFLTRVTFHRSCLMWLVAIRRGRRTQRHFHQRIKYSHFDHNWDRMYPLLTIGWECSFTADVDYRRKESKVVYFDQSGNDVPRVFPQPLTPLRSAILGPTTTDTESGIFYNSDIGQPAFLRTPPKYVVVPWGLWKRQMTHPNARMLVPQGKINWEPKQWQLTRPNAPINQLSSELVGICD